MKANPFSLSFGVEPPQHISRYAQTDEIIGAFSAEQPSNHIFMISGIRGAGKTVLLSSLAADFAERTDWIVVNVTPDTDILNSIAAKLYSHRELKKLFVNAQLDFSAFGLGVHLEDAHQIFDLATALEAMLKEIAKQQKRLLITIDEIVNNEHVRVFSSTFQLLLREKLPVFLLMTGLYENIHNLQNENTLTFLYRAPKILLEPLSLGAVARSYSAVLNVDTDTATHMARLTKGYAFAYQVLGYLYWKNNIGQARHVTVDALLPEYDELLENYVYEKIWHELSPKERDIIATLSKAERTRIADLREMLQISSNNLSVYRDRLRKKGLVDTSTFGYLSLKLPRFGEIIQIWINV